MQPTLSVLCVLVTVGMTQAWYRRSEDPVYGGWFPNRRSHYNALCIEEDGFCKKSYQCCGTNVCSIEPPFQIGVCKPLPSYGSGLYPYGYKKAGQECESNMECIDLCCRRIKIGRTGFKQKCGKPGEYVCVGGNANDSY